MTTSRSTRIWSALALGVGLVAVAGPARGADAPDPTVTTDGSTHTLTLRAHQTKMLVNGEAMSGQSMSTPKPGEHWEFADDLSQKGTKVGSDSVSCAVASADTLNCVATTTLRNGTLVVKGAVPMGMDDNAAFDVPIVSGTGAYDGATGTFHLANVAGSKGADSLLTFTYTLPTKATASASASPSASTPAAAPAAAPSTATSTPSAVSASASPSPAAATQVSKVPAGGAETGGGSTAGVEHGWLLGLGALTAAAGAGVLTLGRRKA